MPWTLCTKEQINALHPIQLSEIKDEWSEMVEGLIRQHTGQPYLGLSQAIVDEWHDGDGKHILKVKAPPIISVQSLLIENASLSAADYVVFSSYIELKNLVFTKGPLTVKVSYTSGSITVPPTVTLAAASMIVAMINYRRRMGADSSLKWGQAGTEQKAGEDSPNVNVGLTSHLMQIMKRILRREYVRMG